MKNTIRILTASLVLASTGYTQTLIGWWRLGEIDPGASSTSGSNATKNPTKDSSGNGWDLTRDATTLTYSSDTPSASQMPISGASTFSMSFDGSSNWGGYSRGVNGNTAVEPTAMTTLAKDFALEAWIKPANTTTGSLPREIIGIGRWDSGVQIMQNGTTLEVSYGSNPTLGGTIKITYPSSVSTTKHSVLSYCT